MLNVITLFSGYDSQCLALNRLGLPYDLVAWAEIDKHACTAHDALFPQFKGRNVGDVSRADWAEWHRQHPQPVDLLTYSSPCQDFSSAGLQRGGEEGSGTRSGLLWETERAVSELRPRHLVFENVGGLVSDKFIYLFQRWQMRLNGYGYTNFAQLMNAKDYGVPQNRLRIFMVSILDCTSAYYFPQPFRLERRLKDVLEQNVAERYYLSDERVAKLMQETAIHSDRGNGFAFRPHTPEEIASTVKCSGIGDKTDNFAAEPRVEIIADLQPDNKRPKSNVVRQQNMLVGVNGLSPCIPATHTRHEFKIAEPTIASMKSRDKDNPTGVRTANNGNFAQRLEASADQSTSNTITSVAKDNLLMAGMKTDEAEPRCIQIGQLYDENSNPQSGRIYSAEGVSPTLDCCQGGNREPKIAEPQINTLGQLSSSQNSRIIGTEGISPAVINGEKDGMPKIMEPTIAAMRGRDKDNPNDRGKSTDNYAQRLEIRPDGTSNTLTSVAKDNLLIEPSILTPVRTEYGKAIRKQYGDNNLPESRHNLTSLQPKQDGTSNTLTSVAKNNYLMEPGIRIRRLTERELYRLMDVDEADIDTLLAAPIPRTQHAKLAGNSIVVACLYYIFRNLFVDTEPAAGTQTTLF